ncbi:MAG: plasmid pRiA4b ORF-3 family protein [Acidobacteria bacterium]|nr:plasmid pRiA4b ORF-3 family protein [Acidobacteriota bacterium]
MIEPVARLRIELLEIEPKVWRRVDVPLSSTLLALHDIIQVTFGWMNSHLFEFEVGDRVYGDPMLDEDLFDQRVYKARSIRLKSLVKRGVERFLYLYDFGDSWRHDISIESVRDGDADVDYPAFVGGERRGPPEDVGGVVGFMEFLEAALNPFHEEHQAVVRWYGKPFDPLDINEPHVRLVLSSLAARRRGPLKSHRGKARRRII